VVLLLEVPTDTPCPAFLLDRDEDDGPDDRRYRDVEEDDDEEAAIVGIVGLSLYSIMYM